MIAVLGGLGAALFWATGTLNAARASRAVGAAAVLAWVMIVGFAVTAPIALVSGIPSGLEWVPTTSPTSARQVPSGRTWTSG